MLSRFTLKIESCSSGNFNGMNNHNLRKCFDMFFDQREKLDKVYIRKK